MLGCYFVVPTERSPACYDLEVCTDTWDVLETVYSVPQRHLNQVEMELMRKWKNNEYGFVPAPSYGEI